MNVVRRFCCCFCFFVSLTALSAQELVVFRTEKLQSMAESLPGINLDTLSEGTHEHFIFNGHPLTVRVNAWNEVEHIGYRLFPSSLKKEHPSPVYEFLERFLLELDLPMDMSPEMRMKIENVKVETGKREDVFLLDGTESFRVEFIRMRKYHVSWSREDKEVLAFSFDMDYQLMTGSNAVELEYNFIRDISRFSSGKVDGNMEEKKWPSREQFHVETGECYLTDAIRNDIYYEWKQGKWSPVCDTIRLYPSVSNIMLTGATPGDYILDMNIDMFGYKEIQGCVSVQKWLAFCRSEGCKAFFGIKGRDSECVSGTLFMVNETQGYNHMLNVRVPVQTIAEKRGEIKGRLYVYIPLHNVSDKFLDFDYYQKKLLEGRKK